VVEDHLVVNRQVDQELLVGEKIDISDEKKGMRSCMNGLPSPSQLSWKYFEGKASLIRWKWPVKIRSWRRPFPSDMKSCTSQDM
jgi:hypothetical protein